MKLHTGDTVVVISGKDKGKTGTIMRVLSVENRVVVTGINMRTRHIKKTPQQAGRIVHFEASLHAGKVMLIDPKTKKRSRVGYKVDEKGNKQRISKISGEMVVSVKPKATLVKKAAKTVPAKSAEKDQSPKQEKETSAAPVPTTPATKQPFWKRMKFGPASGHTADTAEESRMQQDHTIPDQQKHVRKGARGS